MTTNSHDKTVIQKIGTVRIIRSFSVTPEEQETLIKFQEFVDREFRGNLSQGIIFSMKETLERHTPSNPQPTIDRCLTLNMPVKSNNLCCVTGCTGKAHYKLTLKNYEGKEEIFNVCWLHRKWRHPTFRFAKSTRLL
jgi:hypothetical protein